MRRPPEKHKELCAKIAARVSCASRIEILPDCFEGMLSRESAARSRGFAADEAKAGGRIGIWMPKEEPGGIAYVRSTGPERQALWADVDRIKTKSHRRRVILLGESAARGYFYDPGFNPAMMLAAILESVSGPDTIDVVDLACTDQLFDGLVNLMQSAIALLPDAFVIFAGNNWHAQTGFADINSEEIARTLRWTRQWKAVTGIVEERTREAVISLLRTVGGLARKHAIPVIFVLPEFNLVDWHTEFAEPGLIENPVAVKRWREVRIAAEEALASGELDRSTGLAREMLQLAGETDIVGMDLLARSLLSQGERDEARQVLELARDVSLSLPAARSPRCYTVIQETVRATADREGIVLIDLPRRFEEYLGGDLPDRRLFHDYCHLTEAGVRVAMASVAESLLPCLNQTVRSWRQLKDLGMRAEPEVAAEAHFLAAVHNASWGQGFEIVHYHCAEALRTSPDIAATFDLYLDAYVRRGPSLLCRSFQQLLGSHNSAAFKYFSVIPPTTEKDLNLVLIKAILDVLEPLRPGIRQTKWDLLIEEHGLDNQRRDLLHPSCSSESIGEYRFRRQGDCGFYKALEVESHFRFFCGEPKPLEFELVLRLAQERVPDQTVLLLVNGRRLLCVLTTGKWRVVTAQIDPALLQRGINNITIHWPEAWQSWEDRSHELADRFEHEILVTVFYVYGHIHSFWIKEHLPDGTTD